MDGTVIDVRVFTRDGIEKDSRAQAIEKAEIERVRKDLQDQRRILEEDLYQRVRGMLLNHTAAGGPKKLKPGTQITAEYLETSRARSGSRSGWMMMRPTRSWKRPPSGCRRSRRRSRSGWKRSAQDHRGR